MSEVIVAEKPSVAQDIARVVGARTRKEGYLEGPGVVVTWALGHLVRLAEPQEMNPAWKAWRKDTLPMLPREWALVVAQSSRSQFEVVRRLITAPTTRRVICATDAGREGELIFRFIHEASRCKAPVARLWISALTPEAIREGLASTKPLSAYDALAAAARGRAQADWLVGMNLSRHYSLAFDDRLSVGRVQTPTLAILAARERAIRDFVPENYCEVVLHVEGGRPVASPFRATWFNPKVKLDPEKAPGTRTNPNRLPEDAKEAEAIVARARKGNCIVQSIDRQTRRIPPPQLYDLTELQRHANRLFGFSAQKTLEVAQALYERKKVLSYPRTDSRYLPESVAATLPRILESIRGAYEPHIAPESGRKPLGKRFVDDTKVTDHHAIIPTGETATGLTADEARIFDLVCRRLLAAWHSDAQDSTTTVLSTVTTGTTLDHFRSLGTTNDVVGWRVLDVRFTPAESPSKKGEASHEPHLEEVLPAGLREGDALPVREAQILRKQTKPPKRLTDATLLTAMETAGQSLDDKEVTDAMRQASLGTPATRASMIETLLDRGYVVRNGKNLEVTEKGLSLIARVHELIKSPLMTARWENELRLIESGKAKLDDFMKGIESYVRDLVGDAASSAAAENKPRKRERVKSGSPRMESSPQPEIVVQPTRERRPLSQAPREILHSVFGHASFRSCQEQVCESLIAGNDTLLVMPTGAGKSLCYQVPGLARGGTTLVLSPLVALIEDQVRALQQRGLRAERIHSGRSRESCRAVCHEYLSGTLDFLFIAPERLAVPGFPEMLARRPPSLIAIDEAHCISQWGHDFRPDYRKLGERLAPLRPTPIVALTATATPRVQSDIVGELRMSAQAAFIQGFRRTNLAIEVVRLPPSERLSALENVLRRAGRLPAIVFVPTRKQAEATATALARHIPAKAYHGGLDSRERDRIQGEFQRGELDVVVATIAFGMGIDKADIRTVAHMALPSSVEGYYQEIGRAGRDGKSSLAILFHGPSDRRTHDFFFERDYPGEAVLAQIQKALGPQPIPVPELQRRVPLESDVVVTALEKLSLLGAAQLVSDPAGGQLALAGARKPSEWQPQYATQRAHRSSQLGLMEAFTRTTKRCRMLSLMAHFGEHSDEPCGRCDVCRPEATVVARQRPLSERELAQASRMLAGLSDSTWRSSGQLHAFVEQVARVDRAIFERILTALGSAGLVELAEDTFEKSGQVIHYAKARLSPEGVHSGPEALREVLIMDAPEAPTRRRTPSKKGSAWRGFAKKKSGAGTPRKATREPLKGSEPRGVRLSWDDDL